MEKQVTEKENKAYEILLTFSEQDITEAKAAVLQKLAQQTKIKGFREGNAPPELIEKQVDRNLLEREVINHLLSNSYPKILNEEDITPIHQPRVTVVKWQPFTELEAKLEVAEKPEVTIGDYRKEIEKNSEKITTGNSQEELLEIILSVTEGKISELLVEEETDRMLSRLMEQIGQVGLTLDKYLETKNTTSEKLRDEYREGARRTLMTELSFAQLIEEENITVSENEIKEALEANPDESSRMELEKEENRWYIESVLARRKLLNKLLTFAEKPAETSKKKKKSKSAQKENQNKEQD